MSLLDRVQRKADGDETQRSQQGSETARPAERAPSPAPPGDAKVPVIHLADTAKPATAPTGWQVRHAPPGGGSVPATAAPAPAHRPAFPG
jgi:hypothetical protein